MKPNLAMGATLGPLPISNHPAPLRAFRSHNGILSATEAAARLDYLKPDGRVRDSFYARVAPKIGYREGAGPWRFAVEKVEQYRRGELK